MAKRKGLGKGRGKGYENLLPQDPRIHKDSAKGRKQPQKIPNISQPKQKFDLTSAIIEYEGGDMKTKDMLELFSHLIKTGLAWTLQGMYGRTANALIDEGLLDKKGNIIVTDDEIEMLQEPEGEFEHDVHGKISNTVLSNYGKQQLKMLNGVTLYFSDVGAVDLEGDKLIIRKTGTVLDVIDSDRKVNKIIFRVI